MSHINGVSWFWGYENNETFYFFNCIDEARDHAIKAGMFDEICGKDAYMDFDENLFFEASENELKDYTPYRMICVINKDHLHPRPRPLTVENHLLNLIKQHGSIVIKECGAGLFIEKFSDAKGIGNIIDNKVIAKFI